MADDSADLGEIANALSRAVPGLRPVAPLRHLGDAFAVAALREYRKAGLGGEPSFIHRVQRLWELRELDGVAFALQTYDQVDLEDAIRRLRRGPILGGARWSNQ